MSDRGIVFVWQPSPLLHSTWLGEVCTSKKIFNARAANTVAIEAVPEILHFSRSFWCSVNKFEGVCGAMPDMCWQ
ncbi:hypothetical protein FPOA_02936 [Fusarium poae]|uniref:Uncharacterized protein n=1 Tax=Fusarium poae TaxID=36050 RepID=A0A1B8B8E1_FUSPO|nr:hypothetical protein FPOA_02936 [Fusarium poae]